RWEKLSSASAEAALLPRIVWATRLSLRGLVRSPRRHDCASASSRRRGAARLPISAPPRPLVPGVPVKGSGRRKLTELVTDHILGHQYRNELVTVINAESEADELRKNRRAARPRPDDLVASGTARFLRFLEEVTVDKRPLPNRACHPLSPFYRMCRRRTISRSAALLCRVFLPFVGLPQGVTG